jgi:DNA-binding IclR family transcriptional regulator
MGLAFASLMGSALGKVDDRRRKAGKMGRKRIVIDRDRCVGEHAPIPGSVVKSAGRALQILEFFDDVQRAASVREISEVLDYPQSSASILLRSLVVMGYLAYDPVRRFYRPTTRVSLLGSWIDRDLVTHGPVLELMSALNRATGGLIVLATRAQLHTRYVHVVQERSPRSGRLVLGTMRPLVSSGMGLAILVQLPERDVRNIVLRSNADLGAAMPAVSLADVMEAVQRLRRDGMIYAEGKAVATRSVVAMALPPMGENEPYSLGVAGRTEDMAPRVEEIAAIMRDALRRYLPPAPAGVTAA